ncbi:hypothetical protein IV494_00300 [Kaistella sp. G5-32]|uniref:Uncharacterized protein n=1 Tax=Kaistella gelatinilytica TaxID=2787636 RepID=A0ABS0F7B7_9FLAO|nr:hypothetical protein [Kaistella gelatinilytica]MBF8455608.1 hypothetical protein [Kaistella gelatinilytica]
MQRENTLSFESEAIFSVGALICSNTEKSSPVPKSNSSKIFVLKGTIVSNLDHLTNAKVVYIDRSKLSQPLKVKNKKKVTSRSKMKSKVERKFQVEKEIFKTFNDPYSDSRFSYVSSSTVFAMLSNFNSSVKKSGIAAFSCPKAKFFLSRSIKLNLEFYLQNNSISRFTCSFSVRPPPFPAFS